MSINPIATAHNPEAAKKAGSSGGGAPAGAFEEVLARTVTVGQVSPETAAEALRLKMLGSAVYLGGEGEGGAPVRSSVQGLLDRFLEQLPAGAADEAGEDGAAVGTSGSAAAESAVMPVEGAAESLPGNAGTDAIIEKASRRYGVDSELIKAIIKAESNFNPRAVSSAGAQGLMQLMPATARGLGVSDSFDPEQNVMAGTRFLKDMLRRYDGNLDEALAAYNWGPGRVDKHGTSHLPRETRDYLAKVKGYYAQYVG